MSTPLRLPVFGLTLLLATLLLALCPSLALCAAELTAADLVQHLRAQGVPLCFEQVHNTLDDAIRLGAQIAELEKIPPAQRTARQTATLQRDRELRKNGPADDDTVIDWPHKRVPFAPPPPGSDPACVLDAFVAADLDYAWEKISGHYVLHPKTGSFNRPAPALNIEAKSYDELVAALDERLLKPAGLHHLEVIMTMHPWFEKYKSTPFSLALPSAETRTTLTRALEQVDPSLVWTVIGCDPDWLNVSWGPLP